MNSFHKMENYVSSHLQNMGKLGNAYKYYMKVYNKYVKVPLPTAQIRPMAHNYIHDNVD